MMARKRKVVQPVFEEKSQLKISPKKVEVKKEYMESKAPKIVEKSLKQYAKIPIKKRKLPKVNSDSEGEEIGTKKPSTFTKYQTIQPPKIEDLASLSAEIDYEKKS